MQSPIRIFVSSPSDVPAERVAVERVARRVEARFEGVSFSVTRWEKNHYYSAHTGFQEQIDEIGRFDLVIGILWSRLGTPLPKTFGKGMPKPREGAPYPSGTAFEILEAIELRRSRNEPPPEILVYRKLAPTPSAKADDDKAQEELLIQRKAVNEFFRDFFVNEAEGFKAAFLNFEDLDGFERLLEDNLIGWLQRSGRLGRQRHWRVEEKGCPFVGLKAFDARHREVFFGRRSETERARERLEASNGFLLIDGPSGTGKSSLARAGLLPRLRDLNPDLRIAVTVPDTADPLAGLTQALFLADALPELALGDYRDATALARHFRGGGDVAPVLRALDRAVEALKAVEERDATASLGLVLLVDQAETLFATRVPADLRAAYARVLEDLAATGRVRVIATMRANAREAALEVPAFARLINGQQGLSLEPPGEDALAEMIRGPAEAADLKFERDAAGIGLDEVLLRDMAGDTAALPLLQFTLEQLYGRAARRVTAAGARLGEVEEGQPILTLTHADYQALGGLSGAIRDQAEEALRPLGKPARQKLAPLVRALIEEAKGAVVLARPPLGIAAPDPETRELAAALVAARLLVEGTERDEASGATVTTLRFSHERILREWDEAREAAKAAETYLRVRADLIRGEERWRKSGRKSDYLLASGVPLAEAQKAVGEHGAELRRQNPGLLDYVGASEKRATRTQRFQLAAAAVFAAIALATLGLAIWGWQSAREAESQRKIAVTNAEEAESQRQAAVASGEEAERQRKIAVTSAEEAERQRQAAVGNESRALAAAAEALVLNHRPVEAVKLALASWPRDAMDTRPRLQKAMNVISAALSKERLPARIMRHETETMLGKAGVSGVAAMPDGRILSWSNEFSRDRATIKLWDAQTGAQIGVGMRHEGRINGAFMAPDGRILSWATDGTLKFWDPRTGLQTGPDMRHDDSVDGASLMPDGRILSWAGDGTLKLWDARAVAQTGSTMRHGSRVNGILVMPDGRILSWSRDQALKLWDVQTGAQTGPDMRHDELVLGALLIRDDIVLSWSRDNTLKLWDTGSNTQIGSTMHHDDWIRGALVMPDGRILSWSEDKTIKLWDQATGAPARQEMRHAAPVYGALVLPDGNILSWSGTFKRFTGVLKRWDAKTGQQIGTDMRHDDFIEGASLVAGDRVLSWSRDGTLKLWDAWTGLQMGADMRHEAGVSGATVMPDGRIVSWSIDNTIKVWDVSKGGQIAVIAAPHVLNGTLIMPTGSVLAWSRGGLLKFWDARTGQQIGPDMRHGESVTGALVMPDGRILSWSFDKTLKLWDARTGQQTGPDMRHEDYIFGALVMPEERILSWSADGALKLWDGRTGQQIGTDMHDRGFVSSAVMMPDGRILSFSDKGGLKLWDVRTGPQVGFRVGNRGVVGGARVMPDGRILYWSRGGNTLTFWDSRTGRQTGPGISHDGSIVDARRMPDDSILSWAEDGSMKLWDAKTGELTNGQMRHEHVTSAIAIPERRILSWSESAGTIKLWDAGSGAQIGPDMLHDFSIGGGFNFPAAGVLHLGDQRILSWSGEDGLLKFWDISWPAGNLFEIACALLPDTTLDETTGDIGISIDRPICQDPAKIPLPSWAPPAGGGP